MLASAVVVPEDTPSESIPSLKRRQSSLSSDSSKRPRLDTDVNFQSSHGSPLQSATAMSPTLPASRRKSSALGMDAAEEKKRGQRLFGGLLGTLSQTSAKPAHRKRDEIEKRQQEKIRQKDEELAEEKRKQRESIDATRREEQKVWDEQSMHIRHQNMRATSHFLKTNTRPELYYKPWELRAEEEELIKRQIEETENLITAELAEHAVKKGAETGMNEVQPPVSERMESPAEPQKKPDEQANSGEKVETEPVGAEDTDTQNSSNAVDAANTEPHALHDQKHNEMVGAKHDEQRHHDDHAAEGELVEGQEDDVIY